MRQSQWIINSIAAGQAFHVKNQNRYLHNLINLFSLMLIFACYALGIVLVGHLPPIFYVLTATIIFGFCHHCLTILVVHESSHNMFIITKNDKSTLFWNRLFGWFGCAPTGTNFKWLWEDGHNKHHKYPTEEIDPNTCDPKLGRDFLIRAAMILLVPGYVIYKGIFNGKGIEFDCPVGHKAKFYWWAIPLAVPFYGSIYLIRTSFGIHSGLVSLSFLLALQVAGFLILLSSGIQHGHPMDKEKNPFLRSLTNFSIHQHIYTPLNFNYHFEHHLNSTVPWYLLPKYHEAIRKLMPPELFPYIFVEGKGFWKLMAKKHPRIPQSLRLLSET